jgi:hypothetical protein
MVAARESWETDPKAVRQFERFFRLVVNPDIEKHGLAPTLDIDKDDLRRLGEFVNDKVVDFVDVAREKTILNARQFIEPYDLPIAKGLQERMHEFRKLDQDVGLLPVLDRLTYRPPLVDAPPGTELDYAPETDETLPRVAGAICLSIGRSIKLLDPQVKNPTTDHWERAYEVYKLLL